MTHDLPPLPPRALHSPCSDDDMRAYAIAAIAPYKAEIERLRNGGCVRDQKLTQYCAEAQDAIGIAQACERRAEKAEAENAKLRAMMAGQPAQMSTHLGLLPIDSTGMRTLVDECAKLRELLDRSIKMIRADSGEDDPMEPFAYDYDWEKWAIETDAALGQP
jgi:ribosomal protein L16 Arg81 hydroxylase